MVANSQMNVTFATVHVPRSVTDFGRSEPVGYANRTELFGITASLFHLSVPLILRDMRKKGE